MGRVVLAVLGVAAVVVGAVFTGQGANLIPGSFMTGQKTWLLVGVVLVVVGVVALIAAARRPRSR